MNNKQSKSLYLIFGVVIVVLLGLIGYFAYLLIAPPSDTATNTNTTNATANSNGNKNKNSNSNKNANSNKNSNNNQNANNSNTNTADEGLVEPTNTNANANSNKNTNSNSNTNSADETATNEVVAGEGEKVITLYFAKSGSDCGEVYPVKRAVTPADDFYGQIMLADLAGPTADETGYVDKSGSVRLRWVEYTSEGSKVYVNEAYNDLSACDKETVDAQLIKTANTMFDVSPSADGEVIVGLPDEEDTDTNSNSNTNS